MGRDDESGCGKPADWFVIGEQLERGEDFVVTCTACLKKNNLLNNVDDLVPAKYFGTAYRCGDDSNSDGLRKLIMEHHPDEADAEVVKRDWYWRAAAFSTLNDRVHAMSIERRFQRVEGWPHFRSARSVRLPRLRAPPVAVLVRHHRRPGVARAAVAHVRAVLEVEEAVARSRVRGARNLEVEPDFVDVEREAQALARP
jgi:hypothetical protein